MVSPDLLLCHCCVQYTITRYLYPSGVLSYGPVIFCYDTTDVWPVDILYGMHDDHLMLYSTRHKYLRVSISPRPHNYQVVWGVLTCTRGWVQLLVLVYFQVRYSIM